MTKHLAHVLSIAVLVVLTTTVTQAQFTPGPLYDFRASDNPAYPDGFANLGDLGGELGIQGTVPAPGFDTFDFYNVQDGDGSFDVLGGGDDVIIADGFTYEMLVRRNGDGFANNEHQLAAIAEGGDNEVFLFIGTKSDNRGGVDFGDAQANIFTLPAGEWTHFMISVDDETDMAKLYVNGGAPTTFDFEGIEFNENPANDVTLFKTRGGETGSRRFDGDISEARLYDFVLSDAQAQANYQRLAADLEAQPPSKVGPRDGPGPETLAGDFANQVFTEPTGSASGLAQSWYGSSGPTGRNRDRSKAGVDAAAQLNDRAVPLFHAEDGTWWPGSYPVTDVEPYPVEVLDEGVIETEGGDEGLDFYAAKLEGEILIPESGTVRFIDGVDAYAYLAIDTDRSGIAGDSEGEVLLDDNDWTDALAQEPPEDDGDPPPPIVEVDFGEIAEGGEWFAIEFNVLEVDGGDSAMLYWDALDEDGAFPTELFEGVEDEDAFGLLIPDSHLRGPTTAAMHVSSDVIATLPERSLGYEIDVNPADGTADTFVVGDLGEGRDEIASEDLTTFLDVTGTELHINPLGEVAAADGDSFQIVEADGVLGKLTVVTEGWSFDTRTGSVIYSSNLLDPNGDGVTNVEDINLVDANDTAARDALIAAAGTELADSNGDGEFDPDDLIEVFSAGHYDNGDAAVYTEGDWNVDGYFNSEDLIDAFASGGYNNGPAAGAAVPEPGSATLLLLGGLLLLRRRQ